MTELPYQVRVDGVVWAAFLDRREAESYRQNKCFRARESGDVDYYESDFVELHDVRTQTRLA